MSEMPLTDFTDIFGTLDQTLTQPYVPDASSGDGVLRTWEQCQEWAKQYNCDVIEAKDNELFIDIDTEERGKQLDFMLRYLRKHFGPITTRKLVSKQGLPHQHVIVTLPRPLPLITRVALQAAMGSDPMRELVSLRRCEDQEEHVVILFRPRESQ